MIFNQRGFTLIELLVVIFIIGIVVAAAGISLVDTQEKRMEQKSQQLAALIGLAKEQAIFDSEELGIVFSKKSYSFYRLDSEKQEKDDNWIAITDDNLLRERTLPEGLEFELYLEGIRVSFKQDKKVRPQVYILSDGSITRFQINITDKTQHSYSLKFAENGIFELVTIN